jgi:hypothetical protein
MDVKAEDIYAKKIVYLKNKTKELEIKQQEWEY